MVAKVNDILPIIQYTASAGQTVFPYPFLAFASGDIVVTVDSVAKSEGTDYTVSGVDAEDGGDITFTSGLSAGNIVTIYRDMAFDRLTDYQQNGDFLSETINEDFDRVVLMVQQLNEVDARSLKFAPEDTGKTTTIDTSQKSKMLGLDEDGDLFYYSASSDVETDYKTYSNLSSVVADTSLVLNDRGRIQGVGDFEIVNSNPDGRYVELSSTGLWIKPLTPHVDLYGALDGADSTTAFSNASLDNPNTLIEVNPDSTYTVNTGLSIGTASFKIDNPASISGTASLEELNALVYNDGYIGGVPMVSEDRNLKLEIIAGTVRQNGGKAVSSITLSGTTATAIQPSHDYTTGDLVYIRGTDQEEYNVSGEAITVIDSNTYTYEVSGTPASPATGTIEAGVPARWDWISDSAHQPVGVDASSFVTASGATLTIPYLRTYSKVASFSVTPDETLSNALNLSVGPSVGLSNLQLKASVNLTLAAHIYYNGTDWTVSYGAGQGGVGAHNVEITSVTWPSNGTARIDHTYCPGLDVQITPFSNNGAVAPYIPIIRAISVQNYTTVSFHNTVDGTLRADSSPNTSHAFHFKKNFSEGIALDGSGGSYDLDLYKGNIWIYGIMIR